MGKIMGRPLEPKAFTLIELLVVVSIIAILMAISIPMLSSARERGRRAACMNNVRQFIMGIHLYAEDNRSRLPLGTSDMVGEETGGSDEHTPVLSTAVYQTMLTLIGSHKAMMCPWLGEPFDEGDGWA